MSNEDTKRILDVINRGYGWTAAAIVRETGLDAKIVKRELASLDRAGWVENRPNRGGYFPHGYFDHN